MAPQSHEKSLKMEPRGAQCPLILHFYRFLGKSEKLGFSMTFRGDQKARKIQALAGQGLKTDKRLSPGWWIPAPDIPPGRG